VKNKLGECERTRFLIDSVAYYTILKREVWQKLGL